MIRNFALALSFLVASGTVWGVEPLGLQVHSCFKLAGKGQACVSATGNVLSFTDRDGNEMIGGEKGEGYTVLVENPASGMTVTAVDLGYANNGVFSPAVISQPGGRNTLPMTITRKVGTFLEVKLAFVRDAADGDLALTMTFKNLSSTALHGLKSCHFTHVAILGAPVSMFASTYHSVLATTGGMDGRYGPGMSVTAIGAFPVVDYYGSRPGDGIRSPYGCFVQEYNDVQGVVVADGIAKLQKDDISTLLPRKTASMKLVYRGL